MTPDIQFLINCCKTNPEISDIEQIRTHLTQLNNQKLSEITVLAHAHGIFPLVYHTIQIHASDLLSKEILTKLKQQNMSIVMQNMRMTAELIRIMRLLEENGIAALAFKGPTLAQLAYGDITLRQYCDLDILIKPQDLLLASQLLIRHNYQPRVSIEYLHNQTFLDVNHDISFYSDISVELHWRLFEKQLLVQFNPELIWSEYETTEIQNKALKTLKAESLLIYLCIHGSKHAWERIEWITDLDKLIGCKQDLDWQQIIQKSIALKVEHLVLLGLKLSNAMFATELPIEIQKKIHKNKKVDKLQKIVFSYLQENILLAGQKKAYYRKLAYFRMQMQRNWLDKIIFFYRNIIQINSTDIERLGAQKQTKTHYFINRLIRLYHEYIQKKTVT